MNQPEEPLYAERLYDLFQSGRDYAAEVATLKDLVRRHHLAGLKQSFDVAGVDLSAAMLAMARRNAGPEVPLHEANFTTFDLGQTFDVVSCLTSSICHAETAEALTSAVVRMTPTSKLTASCCWSATSHPRNGTTRA